MDLPEVEDLKVSVKFSGYDAYLIEKIADNLQMRPGEFVKQVVENYLRRIGK